ncbi:36439_t:CDS:2, partial [Racocetra persica]
YDDGSDNWNRIEWSKRSPPIYCNSTKIFTFLFNQTQDAAISHHYRKKKTLKYILGAKFEGLASPQLINDDIYKYEFDRQSSLCFKLEIKVEEG